MQTRSSRHKNVQNKYLLPFVFLVLALCVVLILALSFLGQNEPQKQDETTQVKTTETTSSTTSEVTTQQTSKAKERIVDVQTDEVYRQIVNKKHPLDETYNPGENRVAKQALTALIADMQKQGFAISDAYSGFRSYETQTQLYNDYVARDGKEAADKYSARPGYSEHQTGLAFDILTDSGQLLEESNQEAAAKWLKENAHLYGFVVRYQKGKEDITGYMAEDWHIRFVGNDASELYEKNLTLEEYYQVDGGDYDE